MKDLPPPLFFIDRNVEGIQFSPLPLMHIVAREKDVFEVYETASQKLIGKLGAELSPEEHLGYDMDDYMVTMDYHDRIVYKGAERILVYSVRKHSNFEDQADLVLDFELKFPEANNPKKTRKDSLPTRVMPARMSKFNRLFSLCDVSIKIAALNYCETLELFIVLADIPSYAKTGSVLIIGRRCCSPSLRPVFSSTTSGFCGGGFVSISSPVTMSTNPPYSFIRSAPTTGSSMLANCTGPRATSSLWPSAMKNFSTGAWTHGATP
ncbi:hypothetical protein TYRP_013256 [Tyrophagus putrescentiae]|nr:hypothetical protein TYRP_013256 [Tyrophagus putrescentiae]